MLTSMPVFLDVAGVSDRGRVRVRNEDSHVVDARVGYAAVADGMGGYNAGEVASRIAVAAIAEEMEKLAALDAGGAARAFSAEDLLARQLSEANQAVYRAAQRDAAYHGMGTTLVVALWRDGRVVVAHVGDSRLYRLRAGRLRQLTRDHSLLQDQLDRGLVSHHDARSAPSRNFVTRALGVGPNVEADVHAEASADDDLYLLCSDGLTEMLDDADIEAMLLGAEHDLEGAARRLVHEANARGGRDNVTVVLARERGVLALAQRTGKARG